MKKIKKLVMSHNNFAQLTLSVNRFWLSMKIKGERKTCDVPLSLIGKVSGRNYFLRNMQAEGKYASGGKICNQRKNMQPEEKYARGGEICNLGGICHYSSAEWLQAANLSPKD